MADSNDTETKVRDFCSTCGAKPEEATQYLEAHDWDVMAACNSYFQDEDEQARGDQDQQVPAPADAAPSAPRTLDGRLAPQSSGRQTSRQAAPAKRKGVATLASLGSGSHQHDDDDDMDDDDSEDERDDGRGNLFAGGEKSALAVQDPDHDPAGTKKVVQDILAKAKANSQRPGPASEAGPSQGTHFQGTGMTLGGEGVESRSILASQPPSVRSSDEVPQEHVLHIWTDGFSIDDGPLRRYDDPANQVDLQMIRSGRVPLTLMNLRRDQAVEVRVSEHKEAYVPQPKKYRPFSGSGQRLGSPLPGDGSSVAQASSASAPTSTPATSSSAPANSAAPSVDSSQPTVMIRIQMPNGTRLQSRFNTTHSVGDIYNFINGSSFEPGDRSWVLATTFPNKEHSDKDAVLGEMPEFKKGGTAVVKWT